MAPKYKLTYFNGTGRAEPIRYLFAYAGQEYEDHRIKREQWPEIKATTPYGKLPILEIDGQVVAQTNAILRYLAKQFGLTGQNDMEALQADSLLEAFGDYNLTGMRLFREENPERKAEIKKDRASYLEKFEKVLADNPAGVLVGSGITWADLFFAANLSGSLEREPDSLKPYPKLAALVEKVNGLPSIKAWLERRPKSDPMPKGPPPRR